MAEALAAVGLAAAIIQFVDLTAKIIVRVNDLHNRAEETSQTLNELRVRLPLLKFTLEQTHSQIKQISPDPEIQTIILGAVQGSQLQIEVLGKLLTEKEIKPALRRLRKATMVLTNSTREKRLRVVAGRIHEY
jgi:hypothetical protein